MVRTVERAQRRLEHLMRFVRTVWCGRGEAVASPDQIDVRGIKLSLDYGHLIRRTANGLELGEPVKALLHKLQTDESFRKKIEGHFTGYDMRTTEGDPALWVLFGLALAKDIIESTGRKTGHIVHLGRDCYDRHHEVISIIAYTLLQTGICRNGGGLVNLGIVDGGTMKLIGGYAKAKTGRDGHWFFATVSHVADPTRRGGKVGVDGKVLVTSELVKRIFRRIIDEDFAELVVNDAPETYVATTSNATNVEQLTALAERAIRARTSVSASVPREQLLRGVLVALKKDDSPLVVNNAIMLRDLGANVHGVNSEWAIRDPNETESEGVQDLMDLARSTGRTVVFWDPDNDRLGFLVHDRATGTIVNIDGSELLLLAAHNLATYNPTNQTMRVVGDTRALIPLDILGRNLTAAGFPIEVVPAEPGYSNIQEEIARTNAQLGGERTSHFFTQLLTSPVWGATEDLPGAQAGDCTPVATAIFLGMQTHMWEGRSLTEQLAYIRATYHVPAAKNIEKKPQLDDAHSLAKVEIAKHMSRIAQEYFSGFGERLEVSPMISGVRIYNRSEGVAVLIRHSNSGPGFTVSIEHIAGREAEGEAILKLGAAITQLAVEAARTALEANGDSLKDFVFSWKDLEAYKSENPNNIIVEYRTHIATL